MIAQLSQIAAEVPEAIEFIVALKSEDDHDLFLIATEDNIQNLFGEVLRATVLWLSEQNDIREYETSEKYGPKDALIFELNNEIASRLQEIALKESFDENAYALDNPHILDYYIVRFIYPNGETVLGFKRASQFKVTISARNRLVRLANETLRIIDDDVYKIDQEFDFIIYNETIFIVHPNPFVFIGNIEEAIFISAGENLDRIGDAAPFLEIGSLKEYASTRIRAARLVASIASRDDLDRFEIELVRQESEKASVVIADTGDAISPAPGHEMEFLRLLDNRRYSTELSSDGPIPWRADSRRRLN